MTGTTKQLMGKLFYIGKATFDEHVKRATESPKVYYRSDGVKQ